MFIWKILNKNYLLFPFEKALPFCWCYRLCGLLDNVTHEPNSYLSIVLANLHLVLCLNINSSISSNINY